ncbi:flagellar assembly protein FliH [Metabacillus sp. Hm71]|uniref:flagellar assembly protein FliH n=1 Tax=Metabacillus sp. Hm71 TaxID=3450743 RepID=UPI003F42A58A
MSRLIKSQYTNKDEKQTIAVRGLKMLLHETSKEMDNPKSKLEASYLIQSAKEERERLIQAALEEKTAIMQQIEVERAAWEQEREQLFEQVRHEAYAEGLELGRQEALRQHQAFIEESKRIVDLARKDYSEKIQSAEEEILALSIKLAEKVIASSLSETPERFLPLVKQGLNEVKEHEHIKIHVHPANYELLLTHKDELAFLATNSQDVSIYANEELKVNDCFIESTFGRIDISIDTQLEQLKKQLLQLLNEG